MIRKSLALTLVVLLVLLAAGCGKKSIEREANNQPTQQQQNQQTQTGNTTTPSQSTGTTNTQQQPPAQSFFAPEPKPAYQKVSLGPLKVGAVAKVGPLSVTVEEKAVVDKAPGLPPGYFYVVMKATIKVEGKDDYTVNSSDHFKMETPEAKTMPFNIQATAQRSPRLQGTIEAGKSLQGWLGYLIKNQPGTFKYKFVHPDYGDAYWEFTLQ